MKRSLALLIIVGYLALVPFCFFGGMLSMSAHAMTHAAATSEALPCGMSLDCKGEAPVSHGDMYLALTSTLPAGAMAMTALLAIFALFMLSPLAAITRAPRPILVSVKRQERGGIRRPHDEIHRWLSLLEASPNFA